MTPLSDGSPFIQHEKIISSALSLCLQIMEGSMGLNIPAAESRMSKDPLSVLGDMADVLEAAAVRIGQVKNQMKDSNSNGK